MPDTAYTSQDTQLSLAQYRALARNGEATVEQLREALRLVRGDRIRAGATSTKAKATKATAAKKVDIDSDALLAELGG